MAPPGNQAANGEHKRVPKVVVLLGVVSAGSKTAPREGGQEGGCVRETMIETDGLSSAVPHAARPRGEACDPREWGWVERSVWTERMLAALGNGVRGGKECLLR